MKEERYTVEGYESLYNGYVVRFNNYVVASFVEEHAAINYAKYANTQFYKHDTNDTREWDAEIKQ